jgi:O-antigen biosynthesis protein WbqP
MIDTKGSPFYAGLRIGVKQKMFPCLKFRTMKKNAPKDLLRDQSNVASLYISKVGRFLRRTSLDELPQLINCLVGQMSLIGPRPVIVAEVELNALRVASHADYMKPGITGLAQISGRDAITSKERASFDEYYYKHFSFFLDVKIIFKTIKVVIVGLGYKTSEKKKVAR